MRDVFECIKCGSHYLPPEGLQFSDGTAASPLWCEACHAPLRAAGIEEPAHMARLAIAAARQSAAVPRVDEQPARPDVRPSRPARPRRVASNRGGRSKPH
jgi:hypothetical protein